MPTTVTVSSASRQAIACGGRFSLRQKHLGDAELALEVELNLRSAVEHLVEAVQTADCSVQRWIDPADGSADVGVIPPQIGSIPDRLVMEDTVPDIVPDEVVATMDTLPRETGHIGEYCLEKSVSVWLPETLVIGIADQSDPETQRQLGHDMTGSRLDAAPGQGVVRGRKLILLPLQEGESLASHVAPRSAG